MRPKYLNKTEPKISPEVMKQMIHIYFKQNVTYCDVPNYLLQDFYNLFIKNKINVNTSFIKIYIS